MKTKAFLLLIFAVFIVSKKKMYSQTGVEVLKMSYEKLNSKRNVQYDVDFRMKFFSEEDTFTYKVKCYLDKNSADSIFGGRIRIGISDTENVIYDGNYIWKIKRKLNTAIRYNVAKGQTWMITSNFNEKSIWKLFLHPELLLEYAKNPQSITLKTNKNSINERYIISINLPDIEDVTNRKMSISFSEQYLPLSVTETAIMGHNIQYAVLKVLKPVFDSNPPQIYTIKKEITYTDYEEEDFSNFYLPTGVTAPEIPGKNFPQLTVNTIDYKKKVTILDFWYMGCYPCIKSFPHIEQLIKSIDTNLVQVYSVNYYNNNEKDIKKINDFAREHNIISNIFLIDKKCIEDFKVTIWPTFYIIDKNGKISNSIVGYSEELSDSLKSMAAKAILSK